MITTANGWYAPGWAGPAQGIGAASYCGSPEPTRGCEASGYCDYHLGYDGPNAEAPYTKRQLDTVVKQGKEQPRPLTHDETARAGRNRRIARGDLDAMERWYAAQCRAPGAKRRGRAG